MLWSSHTVYQDEPFELESELEKVVLEVASTLFGEKRIYLNAKGKIGAKGKTRNIPDGYLIDLSSAREPNIFVVEVELKRHDLRHIAMQILECSLSYETSPYKVKRIVRSALADNKVAWSRCEKYARSNGFENVDVLLDKLIHEEGRFQALIIIDEVDDELEKALIDRFGFPVEIVTLARYRNESGERLYRFTPFLFELTTAVQGSKKKRTAALDPSEIDTIVVPAREDGFEETFIGENRWWAIRIHSSMIPKIKYIAVYRVAPESAITHLAEVASIDPWRDTNKYVVNFSKPATKIAALRLVPKGVVKPLYAPRYTSRKRLEHARNLDEAF